MISNVFELSNKSKYAKWYCNIIAIARNRMDTTISATTNKKRYYKTHNVLIEIHHIIPQSIDKTLAKDQENLVLLTPKEHYICHLLLANMFDDAVRKSKMLNAVHRTISGLISRGFEVNSRAYTISLKQKSLALKLYRTTSEGNVSGENNPMFGKSANVGKKWYNNGTIDKMFVPGTEPTDFVPGRLYKMAEDSKQILSCKTRGKNNGMFGKVGKATGKSWYHDNDNNSFYLYPDDPRISELIKGRSKAHNINYPGRCNGKV